MACTLASLYQSIKEQLSAAGIGNADLDARLLLAFALNGKPDDVFFYPDRVVKHDLGALNAIISKRLDRMPVSKIVGSRAFYGLDFTVDRNVLDPRPDTELLVSLACRHAETYDGPIRVLDLCTGSGCVLIALLTERPQATGLGADISPAALRIASMNAQANRVADRASFLQSDLFAQVNGSFDIIACNPPYIPSADIDTLDDDVKKYDPLLALDGGTDGMDFYRMAFPQIRRYLRAGGKAFFEIGIGQADDVQRLGVEHGLTVEPAVPDLSGIPRVLSLS